MKGQNMSQNNVQPQDNIVVSFDDVKMKDFRAYWTAVARGDWQGQDEFFAKVVQSWDYKLNPSDPESYGDLDLTSYAVVQQMVREANWFFTTTLKNKLEMSKVPMGEKK